MLKLARIPLHVAWLAMRVWWRIAVVLCVAVCAVVFLQVAMAGRTVRGVGR
jgi:hypothetical protein